MIYYHEINKIFEKYEYFIDLCVELVYGFN